MCRRVTVAVSELGTETYLPCLPSVLTSTVLVSLSLLKVVIPFRTCPKFFPLFIPIKVPSVQIYLLFHSVGEEVARRRYRYYLKRSLPFEMDRPNDLLTLPL